MKYLFLNMHNECCAFPYLISGDTIDDLCTQLFDYVDEEISNMMEYGYDEDELEEFNSDFEDYYNLKNNKNVSEKDLEIYVSSMGFHVEVSKVYEGKDGLINGYNDFIDHKPMLDDLSDLIDYESAKENEIVEAIEGCFEGWINNN